MTTHTQQAFGMIMLNEGDRSITYHDTEEQAYEDIFKVVTDATHWLINHNLPTDDQAVAFLNSLAEEFSGVSDTPYKDVYEAFIESWLEGESAGYYMSVEPMCLPLKKVSLRVDGCVVSLAEPLPKGVSVEVFDYDSENYDEDELAEDSNGEEYKHFQL